MVKIVDGQPVQVPDDDRITPDMKCLRTAMNGLLQWLQSPAAKEVERQYRAIRLSDLPAEEWYYDPTDLHTCQRCGHVSRLGVDFGDGWAHGHVCK